MFKTDSPITSRKEDRLKRTSFAENVAKAILEYEAKESLVLGLYGVWGSGKTSIINMVIESIKDSDTKALPIVCRFNPWNYSDQNQLITQFFKQLSLALGRKDKSNEFKNAAKRLDLYAKLIEPLQHLPPTTLPATLLKKICDHFSTSFRERGVKSLEEVKSELNGLLGKQGCKIVVVIDDIDRLNNTEIRQIFQLVKSLGDFKNTVYFLAFDKDVVVKALSEVQKGDGYEYLAKVIQVPFAIPTVSVSEVHRFLFASLDSIIKDLPENRWDKQYWTNIFHSGIRIFFKNIRDVNRFINIFKFKYLLLKDDVNVIDLLAITAIQVFLPDLHSEIRDNKNIFVEGYKDTGYGRDKKEYFVGILGEIIDKNVRHYSVEQIKELLKELFPKLNSIYGNIFYGETSDSEWRKDGRICSEDNFDIFFQLGVSSGQISKSEIEGIISKSKNYEELCRAVSLLNKQGRISEFLERLLDYSGELPQDKIQNIVTTLMDQGDGYPKDEKVMLGFDNISRISRVGYFFTKDLHEKNKCYEVFKNAISATENSIHTIIDAIVFLGWEHGKETKEAPKPEEERRVDEKQLEELEELACQKIEKWAKEEKLIKHRNLIRILHAWEAWAGKQIVKEYVQGLIKTEDGLIAFITKFPSEVRSQSIGDYGYRIEHQVHLHAIKHFTELKEIVPKLRSISSSEKFKDLPDDQKRAIELVLDTHDGKIKSRF